MFSQRVKDAINLELEHALTARKKDLELIRQLDNLNDIQSRVKVVTEHLLLQVDEDFKLPVDVDLIAETIWLIDFLENGSPQPD